MFSGGEAMDSPTTSSGLTVNGAPTMTERLKREKAHLGSRLSEVEAALTAIESHPEIQKVMDSLAKLHWLR